MRPPYLLDRRLARALRHHSLSVQSPAPDMHSRDQPRNAPDWDSGKRPKDKSKSRHLENSAERRNAAPADRGTQGSAAGTEQLVAGLRYRFFPKNRQPKNLSPQTRHMRARQPK